MLVLAPTESVALVTRDWERYAQTSGAIRALTTAGGWAEVHLDVRDGVFEVSPIEHEIDWLEVAVGNALACSIPLFDRGGRLAELRVEWLPFYTDELRAERLSAAQAVCLGYLERIPWYVDRKL